MRLILAILATVFINTFASADITNAVQKYNEASSQGTDTEKLAAAKNMGAAIMQEASHQSASAIAHEAAWTLCELGDYASAQPIAQFALTLPDRDAAVAKPTRQLLSRYIDWSLKTSSRNRRALDEALEETVGMPPSVLSVMAHKSRVEYDALEGRMQSLEVTATRASQHLLPIKDVVSTLWADYKQSSLMAAFYNEPKPEHLYEQADLEGTLSLMRDQEDDDTEKLEEAYWRASAWRMAMEAYFARGNIRHKPDPERVDEILASYGITEPTSYDTMEPETIDEEGVPKLPFCPGEFNMKPKLKYPMEAARKGRVGAVIAKVSVKDGKVGAVKILSSVPDEGFKASAAETVQQWTWDVSDGEPGITCRADRKNIILPMAFQME